MRGSREWTIVCIEVYEEIPLIPPHRQPPLMSVSLYLKAARRSSRPDLTVGLEAIYHHLPLGLVLPEVTEELFLIRIILADPLQASLYPALDILLVECQTEVEELCVTRRTRIWCVSPASSTIFPPFSRL